MLTTKAKPISLTVQRLWLDRLWPLSQSYVRRGGVLYWTGALVPTAVSQTYTLGIEYRLPKHPIVRVVTPALGVPREQYHDVHRYSDGRLCLYWPNGEEFDVGMLLARTIVPWAVEWLFFYEMWLATGTWMGGGIRMKKGETPDLRGFAA